MKINRLLKVAMLIFLIIPPSANAQYMLKDLWPGSTDGFPYYITSTRDVLFFRCENSSVGRELWKSDGTALGTALLKDIYSGSNNSSPTEIFEYKNKVLFAADDGVHGVELWISNGASSGTSLLKDLYSGGNWSDSHPHSFVEINNKVVFVAEISSYQHEPMVTDGTTNGTKVLKDIYAGSAGSLDGIYSQFYRCGDYLYFAATNQNQGTELWKTDGTTNGTVMVKDINPGSSYGLKHDKVMGCYNNEIYFSARDGSGTGYELWKSDGTSNGTVLVKDINPGNQNSEIGSFCVANGILYFRAEDGTNGRELWRTDGSTNGTYLVKDIYPGSGSSFPDDLIELDGKIYFSASGFNTGNELFVSDGTSAGTKQYYDFYYLGDSYPRILKKYGGLLYYSVDIPNTVGREAFVIDGDSANTQILKDIYPGQADGSPGHFTVFQEKLYFQARSQNHGTELWVFDPCQGTGISGNVNSTGDSLISTDAGMDYQWYYCGSDEDLIMTGENDSVFSPVLSGKYKVVVTGSGCLKSSACTFVQKDLHIEISNDSIRTDPIAGATYQWYDCDAGSIVTGQSNPAFQPKGGPGNFAVIISLNGISDTSECVEWRVEGIKSFQSQVRLANLYPNPALDELNVEFFHSSNATELLIQSLDGKTVLETTLETKSLVLDVSSLNRGLYLVILKSEKGVQMEKVLLQ